MAVKNIKNYYEILGVTPDSSVCEVKGAYRMLARKFHPDINKAPESVQKFKDISEAYETLSNESKRKKYDMLNGFYKTPNTDTRKNEFEYKKTSTTARPTAQKNTTEKNDEIYRKKFIKKSINSILDEITKNHNKKFEPKNGDDIHTEITISLSEAVNGTERILNIMHKELCPNCKGRKFINGTTCKTCNGTGEYSIHKKITVKIPKNIKNNSKLRLLNEGNPGFHNGKNGSLYITVKIEQNSNLKIDGANILCTIPITPFEAVLGGSIEVPSFDTNLHITIPPLTHSGQKFRLAKQGLKTNGKFGDMIVTVEIQISKDLSSDEIKLYEKLKKLSQSNIRENLKND